MCEVLDRIEQKGIAIGEARGENRGEEWLARLIQILIERQEYDKISEVSTNPELRKMYYKQYGIL